MQKIFRSNLWCRLLFQKQSQGIFYRNIRPEGVPNQPEKSLFSSVIEQDLSPEESLALSREHSIAFSSKETQNELRPFKKLADFELTKSDYSQINQKNPKGKVNVFTYKNTKFTLVGSQYEFIPAKNLYKIMAFAKPSVIVLQMRPDQILKSIDTNPQNKSNKFSNRGYFSQLIHNASSIVPSQQLRYDIYNNLMKNGILINDNESDDIPAYKPFDCQERLSLEAITVASLFGEDRKIDIVLGDIPEIVYRQNIANSLTLLQLQNIFTECSRELAYHPDLKPQTPYTIACLMYPEIFLKPIDSYMSTLFEYMIHKGYDNIFGLVGHNQSESLKEYLDKRKVSNLEKELEILPVPQSIIRETQGEEILEKHALLDALVHGKEILNNLENINFKTTYEIIKKYSDPKHIDSRKFDEFRVLHYQFLVKYQSYCEKEYESGKINLRRDFLRQMNI